MKTGDRVQVSLPYGTDEQRVHLATIERVEIRGPLHEHRNVKVRFDDGMLMGGTGEAWVSPDVLADIGFEPARAERTSD